MKLTTPILFVCYKRYEYVEKTLSKILEHNPNNLYISIDAPRTTNDVLDVNEVKLLIKKILLEKNFDEKNVQYKIEQENIGCELNILNSIDWVFKKENEVIIIEEDVLIGNNFFGFIINNKEKVISGEYTCISKVLYNSLLNIDSFQFNAHGWYINKDNWYNTFLIRNFKNNTDLIENIIKSVYKPSPDAYKAVKYTMEQHHFHWDEKFKWNIFLQNKKILYLPENSTEHIGIISTNKDDIFMVNDNNEIIKLM